MPTLCTPSRAVPSHRVRSGGTWGRDDLDQSRTRSVRTHLSTSQEVQQLPAVWEDRASVRPTPGGAAVLTSGELHCVSVGIFSFDPL